MQQQQGSAQPGEREGRVRGGIGDPVLGKEPEHRSCDEVDRSQAGCDDGECLGRAREVVAQADRQGADSRGGQQHERNLPQRAEAVPYDGSEHGPGDDEQQGAHTQQEGLGAGGAPGHDYRRGRLLGLLRGGGSGHAWGVPDRIGALDLRVRCRVPGSHAIGQPRRSRGQGVSLGDVAGEGLVPARAGDHPGAVVPGRVEIGALASRASHGRDSLPEGSSSLLRYCDLHRVEGVSPA